MLTFVRQPIYEKENTEFNQMYSTYKCTLRHILITTKVVRKYEQSYNFVGQPFTMYIAYSTMIHWKQKLRKECKICDTILPAPHPSCKFFISASINLFLLKFPGQQESSTLHDSSEYDSWF